MRCLLPHTSLYITVPPRVPSAQHNQTSNTFHSYLLACNSSSTLSTPHSRHLQLAKAHSWQSTTSTSPVEMAKKWHKAAAIGRRMIQTSPVACRGHVVVYSRDGKRLEVPIAYLHTNIFSELFKMSEEEFGLPSVGPITLPCDAVIMEYAVSLLTRRAPMDVERALLTSINASGSRCSAISLPQQGSSQQEMVLSGF